MSQVGKFFKYIHATYSIVTLLLVAGLYLASICTALSCIYSRSLLDVLIRFLTCLGCVLFGRELCGKYLRVIEPRIAGRYVRILTVTVAVTYVSTLTVAVAVSSRCLLGRVVVYSLTLATTFFTTLNLLYYLCIVLPLAVKAVGEGYI